MKSERRHELQQNELAAYLGRINRSIEPYSKLIAVVLAIGIVAAIGYGLYTSKASGERSDATLQLIQASGTGDPEVLAQVGDDYPATAAGAWARLYQGNQYLGDGMRMLYTGGPAEDMLDQAIDAFNEAIALSENRLLQSRAHFGIARAEESLGEIEAAIEAYKATIAVNESEAMVKRAQERIDSLSSSETQGFLAWFGEQDFTPADPSLPPSLPSGTELPELPDLDLPDIGGAAEEDKDLEGGIEMPAENAGTADAEQSDAEQSDTEQADTEQAGAADESSQPDADPGSPSESAAATESNDAEGSPVEAEPTADDESESQS